ncbi:receptor-like protein 33, partial [Quercus suber]
AFNNFFGPIPASLCNATQLQIIDLGENNFIGSVPTDLGNLLALYQLRLSISVLEIGLACSMESPKERMNMEEVTREMHLIKNAFLGSKIRRGGLI